MSLTTHSFPLTGGMDRSITSLRANQADFYLLRNMRQSRDERGKLETTPYFKLSRQYTQATYWNTAGATSATEGATSPVLLSTPVLGGEYRYTITQKGVWLDQVGVTTSQMQVFDQEVATTTTSDLNSGCLCANPNGATPINLGSTLDVVIDGATTFKWRKNGGAYTTTVTIAASVTIDTSTILYFLTTTGFTVGDAWSWRRVDSMGNPATSANISLRGNQLPVCFFNNSIYVIGPNNRVYQIDSQFGVQSIGYRPIYGRDLIVFQNHLFVLGAVESTDSDYALFTISAPFLRRWYNGIACSDRDNFNNFISSDVNEADYFYLGTGPCTTLYTTGDRIFVITLNEIFQSPYLGLPIVFDFTLYQNFSKYSEPPAGTFDQQGLYSFRTEIGVLIQHVTGFYLFDGVNVQHIGSPVANLTTAAPIGFCYLSQCSEVCILIGTTIFVWQVLYNKWYTRGASFTSTIVSLGVSDYGNYLWLGAVSRNLYVEDTTLTGTPVKDKLLGTLYTLPEIGFHLLFFGNLLDVKELSAVQLGALASTAGSSYPATAHISLSCAVSATGQYPASGFVDSSDTFTTSDAPVLPLRLAFRALAVRLLIEAVDTNTAPCAFVIYAVDALVNNVTQRRVER